MFLSALRTVHQICSLAMVRSVSSRGWGMRIQLVGNIRVAQEKLIWKLFIQDALSKYVLQQHVKGWELLRDCVFILVKKRHSFARYII